MNRPEAIEKARAAGIEDPESLGTKANIIAATQQAEEAANQPLGALVQVQEDGKYAVTPMGGMGLFGIPTHLRRAAQEIEKALIEKP